MAARALGPAGLLGVLSTLVCTAACTEDSCNDRSFDPPPEPEPGPTSPPTIVAGEWIGSGTLELQFSKPITAVGDLDPRRFSILAWDAQKYGSACYEQTAYRSMGVNYYNYPPQAPIAAAWIGPEDDTRLRLRLSNAAVQCPTSPNSVATGVMLVYTNNPQLSGQGLQTEGGDPLADIGPTWAVTSLDDYFDGDSLFGPSLRRYNSGMLPSVDTLVDIPCPG